MKSELSSTETVALKQMLPDSVINNIACCLFNAENESNTYNISNAEADNASDLQSDNNHTDETKQCKYCLFVTTKRPIAQYNDVSVKVQPRHIFNEIKFNNNSEKKCETNTSEKKCETNTSEKKYETNTSEKKRETNTSEKKYETNTSSEKKSEKNISEKKYEFDNNSSTTANVNSNNQLIKIKTRNSTVRIEDEQFISKWIHKSMFISFIREITAYNRLQFVGSIDCNSNRSNDCNSNRTNDYNNITNIQSTYYDEFRESFVIKLNRGLCDLWHYLMCEQVREYVYTQCILAGMSKTEIKHDLSAHSIALQLFELLYKMTLVGVAHRDVKPGNIVFFLESHYNCGNNISDKSDNTSDKLDNASDKSDNTSAADTTQQKMHIRCKIVDFGNSSICCGLDRRIFYTDCTCTLFYAPPEDALGRLTDRFDIFCTCATLIQYLCFLVDDECHDEVLDWMSKINEQIDLQSTTHEYVASRNDLQWKYILEKLKQCNTLSECDSQLLNILRLGLNANATKRPSADRMIALIQSTISISDDIANTKYKSAKDIKNYKSDTDTIFRFDLILSLVKSRRSAALTNADNLLSNNGDQHNKPEIDLRNKFANSCENTDFECENTKKAAIFDYFIFDVLDNMGDRPCVLVYAAALSLSTKFLSNFQNSNLYVLSIIASVIIISLSMYESILPDEKYIISKLILCQTNAMDYKDRQNVIKYLKHKLTTKYIFVTVCSLLKKMNYNLSSVVFTNYCQSKANVS